MYLSGSILLGQQNLKDDYTPLKSQGTLPDIFTQNIRKTIKKDISELEKSKEKDKKLKSEYYTEANYEIEKIVKSGNVLINDEVTSYLNKIADIILVGDTSLRRELHIFALKSTVVNAYSYDKGYIFINLGLIAQAETEAQLAFTLCHEIMHYTKRHSIQCYVKTQKIDKENYNGKSDEDKLIEICRYSKEQESEADIEGFALLEKSKYDIIEAEKDFDVMQYSHLPFELVEFKKEFFETKNFKIPDRYLLKSVSPIRYVGNEDDTKSTHPNTHKRREIIKNLIINHSNEGRSKFIVGQDKFEHIRDLCRFEICRLHLINRDYPNSFYSSYILQSKYPKNRFLVETIAKSLYGLTLCSMNKLHYTSDSYLERGIPGYENIESYPQQFYHLYNKMPLNEWSFMVLNYIYRAHKNYPSSKVLTSFSDSLFKYIAKIDWGIADFVRMDQNKLQANKLDSISNFESHSKSETIAHLRKNYQIKNNDTAYYKEIFIDLFMSDEEFSSKFPFGGAVSYSGFSNYELANRSRKTKKTRKGEYILCDGKIEKVILLEPFYLKTNEFKNDEVHYLKSDTKQEKLVETINKCAAKQNFNLITLDPGLLNNQEVEKLNDYSLITDWFSEKFDGIEKDQNEVLNSDQITNFVLKYGTQFVMKTGVVSYKVGKSRSRTYYYCYVYDIQKSSIVYKKYEAFRDKDTPDLINAKVYQTFYELIHS